MTPGTAPAGSPTVVPATPTAAYPMTSEMAPAPGLEFVKVRHATPPPPGGVLPADRVAARVRVPVGFLPTRVGLGQSANCRVVVTGAELGVSGADVADVLTGANATIHPVTTSATNAMSATDAEMYSHRLTNRNERLEPSLARGSLEK